MRARLLLAVAFSVAALLAAFDLPAPGRAGQPPAVPSGQTAKSEATSGPTLAPIVETDETPDPSWTGRPKTLGHIYTSAACSTFVHRFNIAAVTITANDQRLESADDTLHQIEADYHKRDGALRVYDERNRLIASVAKMTETIPDSQRAVNELLAQAKATNDPARKKALHESASRLQESIDRQRAMAYDLTGVVHVLLDKHTYADTMEAQITSLLPPGAPRVNLHPGDLPVPEPGSDSMAPPPPRNQTTVDEVMQWTRQRFIIARAESRAETAAAQVMRTCRSEPPAPQKP